MLLFSLLALSFSICAVISYYCEDVTNHNVVLEKNKFKTICFISGSLRERGKAV